MTRRHGRRRKKLLDDLKDRRGYSHLKEEAVDRTMWRTRFGGGIGPVIRQTAEWMNDCAVLGRIVNKIFLLCLLPPGSIFDVQEREVEHLSYCQLVHSETLAALIFTPDLCTLKWPSDVSRWHSVCPPVQNSRSPPRDCVFERCMHCWYFVKC